MTYEMVNVKKNLSMERFEMLNCGLSFQVSKYPHIFQAKGVLSIFLIRLYSQSG